MVDHVSLAREKMLISQPFFGSLAVRLYMEPVPSGTMATDGTTLRYCPAWAESQWRDSYGIRLNSAGEVERVHLAESYDSLVGTIAHEVEHCAMLHPWRLRGKDHDRMNRAADYVVNGIILRSGLTLPDGALYDADLSSGAYDVETVYRKLGDSPEPEKTNGPGEPGQNGTPGEPGTGQPGEFTLPPETPEPGEPGTDGPAHVMSPADWESGVESAAMIARKAGNMPGESDRAHLGMREPDPDPWEILRDFISRSIPGDYSWSRPNRRLIGSGLYLPGIVNGTGMPKIYVVIDASGSVTAAMLESFTANTAYIGSEFRPESIEILYHDTRVTGRDSFGPDDTVEIRCRAGGGTDFRTVLPVIDEDPEPPACVIWLTDLDGPFPTDEPAYPVLWVTPHTDPYSGRPLTAMGPFGQTIRIRV